MRHGTVAGTVAYVNCLVSPLELGTCAKCFKELHIDPALLLRGIMGRLLKESDPGPRLVRGAEGVLRHALESGQLGSDAHNAVRRSLRSLCRVARTHGVHVEQLVVLCKDAWRNLPQARELAPEARAALIEGVISQCIDEYYRTDRTDMALREPVESPRVPDASLSFMFGPLS